MNFDEIVVKESPGLCRCCLSEGCYKDLGSEYTWMNETEVYAEMLLDCFDIGITQHSDGPNGAKRLICEVCITRLRDACNFKKQVLDSEKRFIDMLGRGEFRPKVLIYQQQDQDMKEESEEPTDMDLAEDVEYLEDLDYGGDEEVIKSEDVQSTSLPTTSEDADRPKLKRGRPKKEEDKSEKGKAKKAKAAKDFNNIFERIPTLQRKDDLVRLFTLIIENTTVMPFRWHCNKYMCFFCGCPFTESVHLKQHNEEEHADTKIRNAFRSLLRNCRIKFEVSQIKCKRCSKEFAKLDQILDHLRDFHDFKINLSLKTELFAFKLSDDKMACDECGDEFQFFGTLLRHFHMYHNKNEPYLCEICGMGFVAKSNVSAHVKNVHTRENPCKKCLGSKDCTHSRPNIKCPKCPETFSNLYQKKRHLATVHDVKGYQFACDLCPQVFPVRCRLICHKQRVHLKQRTFACEICGYRAFNKDSLARHMVSHDDSRPFECEFCKKAFQRKKTLEFHRRIHTNDKRCVCKECGKAFVQTTSLKLHYRVHHPKEGARESGWT